MQGAVVRILKAESAATNAQSEFFELFTRPLQIGERPRLAALGSRDRR
jgi:hypothetical protein